jgi:sortase A
MTPALAAHLDRATLVALARAEASGAAPGTECPHRVAPTVRRRPRRSRLAAAMITALIALGVAGLAHATWVHAKALAGQWLLSRAWSETQRAGRDVKPWPWADLHPVARLTAPAHGVDVLVVEGANGRALAWAPGHAERSPLPGRAGNAVITGHRDTHFAFLRSLARGDALVVEDALGARTTYRVREARIADYRSLRVPAGERSRMLTLVTCWPFDGVQPDTPWRYVVLAEAEDPRATIT